MLIDFYLSLKLHFCVSQHIDVPVIKTVGVLSTLKDRFSQSWGLNPSFLLIGEVFPLAIC